MGSQKFGITDYCTNPMLLFFSPNMHRQANPRQL
jgi:hypothetical protein